ncbi:MAG: hypothetical protein ABSB86_15755 [Bryobacteraceae bacterium]
MRRARLSFVLLAAGFVILADDFPYRQPPKAVEEVLKAPATPVPSVSPQHDAVIFLQPLRYPPIAEVGQPMLRLGGIRIDTNTNGLHLAPYYLSFALKRLPDGGDIRIATPKDAKLGAPIWSPDGKQFAFTNTTLHGIELWVGSSATGDARRIDGVSINGVRVGRQSYFDRKPGAVRTPRASRGERHTQGTACAGKSGTRGSGPDL